MTDDTIVEGIALFEFGNNYSTLTRHLTHDFVAFGIDGLID